MAYQSLYRKYRSRDFGDLVGQRHVTQTLANAIGSERVSHAYLFCGPRGTGKTSTARVLAKALNCVNGPTAKPCDVCPYCISIRQGSAMDVIEIDAASNRNIDDIRQLREQVNYPPVELRYKFYIVDEVHQLTKDAYNAFLKTLEEPPPHVVFVLCTTDPHQLPATILSRCQRFDFHRITLEEIVDRLRWVVGQEGWTAEDEALYLVGRSANGGMRDALSLLDQTASYAGTAITAQHVREILGGIDLDLLTRLTDLILQCSAEGLFKLIDDIMSEGKDVPQLVAELILHWRNLLRAHIGGGDALAEFTPEQRAGMVRQAKSTDQAGLIRAITLWCEAENELRWNSQQRLVLELTSLRIMSKEPQAVAAPVQQDRPAPRAQAPAPVRPAEAPARQEPRAPEQARPSVAPPAAQSVVAPAASADGLGGLTLPKLKKAWPQLIESMKRSSTLDNLRTRIVEKVWPTNLIGNCLTLGSTSPLVRAQMKERPIIKDALEKCLASFFKASLVVLVEDDSEAPVAPDVPARQEARAPEVSAPEPPAPEAPTAEAPAPEEPKRDIVGERMRQVFVGCEELSGQ